MCIRDRYKEVLTKFKQVRSALKTVPMFQELLTIPPSQWKTYIQLILQKDQSNFLLSQSPSRSNQNLGGDQSDDDLSQYPESPGLKKNLSNNIQKIANELMAPNHSEIVLTQSPNGSAALIKEYQVQNVYENLEEQVELDELKANQKKSSKQINPQASSQMQDEDIIEFVPIQRDDDFLSDKCVDTSDLPKPITDQATDTQDLRAIYISKQVQTAEVEEEVVVKQLESTETQTTDLPEDIQNKVKGYEIPGLAQLEDQIERSEDNLELLINKGGISKQAIQQMYEYIKAYTKHKKKNI
eukprot:TRINITY_DN1618_c0_g1_i2.p1 TRINITY_DN1618_c0_g1~~TRINITY_DN1618_c0_g1_i2.p1  ORF type:complete len:298 (-),score=57.16 TRINITY_DN1618_c0_g1_i2:227-1120(-)